MTTLATINQQGINTMVVDNQTATRIATIMSRSNDVITSVGSITTKNGEGVVPSLYSKIKCIQISL